MKRIISVVLLLLSLSFAGHAQNSKLDKDLDKANDLINQQKYDDADKYLEKLLDKNTDYGKGWDLLVSLRYKEYEDAKSQPNGFGGNFKITETTKNGDTIKNDTLAAKLAAMMNAISPAKLAFNKFLYTARQATLMSNSCTTTSFYLRELLVDVDEDTNINADALKYFKQAEAAFSSKNYEDAAGFYKQAIQAQPNFYKANMYLGDAYYGLGRYADAANIFKGDIEKFPHQLEPRKYLIDTYAKLEKYDNAMNTAIESMTVYPDYTDESKITDLAQILNRKINIIWTPRPVFPNKVGYDSTDINSYAPDKPLKAKKPWTFYESALDKIQSYCNKQGIIVSPNSLTQSKYLEVYSWEEMLKNSTDPQLDEARKMQKAGYLDCYVLITCFHQDIYDQYLDFVTNNHDKVVQYFKTYIN